RARLRPRPQCHVRAVELRDCDAVALSDDLAACNLRLVGDDRAEVLVAEPRGDELRRLHPLLRSLEEIERAEDAVPGLDQVVALESRELVQLREEGLVDLACQLDRAILVHTVITANGRMHVMLLLSDKGRRVRTNSLLRPGRV